MAQNKSQLVLAPNLSNSPNLFFPKIQIPKIQSKLRSHCSSSSLYYRYLSLFTSWFLLFRQFILPFDPFFVVVVVFLSYLDLFIYPFSHKRKKNENFLLFGVLGVNFLCWGFLFLHCLGCSIVFLNFRLPFLSCLVVTRRGRGRLKKYWEGYEGAD